MTATVYVPRDAAALALGADAVAAALNKPGIRIVRTGSRGLFWLEPMIEVATLAGRIAYGPVSAADVPGLIDAGLLDGGAHKLRLGQPEKIPFLARQTRLTFARCGVIDPLSIEDYRAHGGMKGLARARELGPAATIEEVTQSGLRGRGGAGFPTGIKWKTTADAAGARKYIVCNADEGDSGTYADRMLMEGDPFALVEGMAIAGFAVGAGKGYVYTRSEYPHAIATFDAALTIARREGLLDAAFDIEQRVGAGAYVCGEETSLLESLEGRRGQVRAKPPLPAHQGLFGMPTVVNNVISLASVPTILVDGAEQYKALGFGRSRGTMPIQLAGNIVVNMVPFKDGKANHGHSCVKGRFAWGYATHRERILKPMVRAKITDPWREVSWDEAITHVASEFKRIQVQHGRGAVGVITSSRCTNEETYLMQKLARAGFLNNNTDTCARVCHSPTGYGLSQTFGTSAGTQDFDSVEQADVIMVIGANPIDGHPVFASRRKKRLRAGAKLIVIDPRRTDLVRTPHIEAVYHLPLKPGTNVAVLTSLAHVIVTEALVNQEFVRARCEDEDFAEWAAFVAEPRNSPEEVEKTSGVPAASIRGAARLCATGGNAAIYYGLGVTEHSQGTTAVMAIANLAMATGNIGKLGVGVNPLRGQNNVQGSCDMGSFPHELPGYRHVSDPAVRAIYEREWGVAIDPEPGLRISNMLDAAVDGTFLGIYIQGEDIAQSDPDTHHITSGLEAMECVVVQDLFLNETANYAHVFLPGSTFLEKDGTFINAERRINMVRKVMAPRAGLADWEVTQAIANAYGLPMHYTHPSEIMDEIARTTPTFAGVSFAKLDAEGSVQWPCNEKAPHGTPVMHMDGFVRGKGRFFVTEYIATDEKVGPRFPLLLTTGRILSQYNVGAQTRRTANVVWHPEDVLEIHPHDAEQRGIKQGDLVRLASRVGATTLHVQITDRVAPGVVYTTFHHPETQANVITTDYADWATSCPEYKVTAVQVAPSNGPSDWQTSYAEHGRIARRIELVPAK